METKITTDAEMTEDEFVPTIEESIMASGLHRQGHISLDEILGL
jgi:hypothetical protein